MKSFFAGEKIAKGAVADKYNRGRPSREFWAAQDALNTILFNWDSWNSGMETDPDTIREALQDFVDIAQTVLIQEDIVKAMRKPPEQIARAGKKISDGNMKHIDDAIAALTELKTKTAPEKDEGNEEEDDLNTEDIAKAVQAAVAPIAKQVEALSTQVTELKKQEGEEPGQPAGTEPPAEPQANALTDAITKALAPLTEQVQALATDVQVVKNSRGGSVQGGTGEDDIQKSAGVSFGGLL
ncbi:hypothetical protein ACU1JV_22870 [Paenibacillus sp. T2-29]|uniref:hypothetical protein n=1 Tax=Paenibacillus TaxID=44249 RepID=UPI0039BCE4F9